MAQKEAVNTFTGGMVMDTHPLTTPNNVLTNCLNGTLVTFNGNEMILQNDMGNTKIESKERNGDSVRLQDGFVPVGTTELGGIIYIASFNPNTNQCQLGCFPSPERNQTTSEQGAINYDDNNFSYDDLYDLNVSLTVDNHNIYKLSNGFIRIDLTTVELHPGDKYTINIDGQIDPNCELKLVSVSEDGNMMNLNYTQGTECYYTAPNSGKLCMLVSAKKLESFNCSYSGLKQAGHYDISPNPVEQAVEEESELDNGNYPVDTFDYKGKNLKLFEYKYYKIVELEVNNETIYVIDENVNEIPESATEVTIDDPVVLKLSYGIYVKYTGSEFISVTKEYALLHSDDIYELEAPSFKIIQNNTFDYYKYDNKIFVKIDVSPENNRDDELITLRSNLILTFKANVNILSGSVKYKYFSYNDSKWVECDEPLSEVTFKLLSDYKFKYDNKYYVLINGQFEEITVDDLEEQLEYESVDNNNVILKIPYDLSYYPSVKLSNEYYKRKNNIRYYTWNETGYKLTLNCSWNNKDKENKEYSTISEIAIPDLNQVEAVSDSNSSLSTEVIIRNSNIQDGKIKFDVYPIIQINEQRCYIDELKQTILIDTTLEEGEVKLVIWKYFYNNNINLYYGFSGRLADDQKIKNIEIFAEEYSTDSNRNKITLIDLSEEESYFGTFFKELNLAQLGLLENKLYAITIKINTNYSEPIYEYRWLYTNTVFNNQFDSDVIDYEKCKIKLSSITCDMQIGGDNDSVFVLKELDLIQAEYKPIVMPVEGSPIPSNYETYGYTRTAFDDDISYSCVLNTNNDLFTLKTNKIKSKIVDIKVTDLITPYAETSSDRLVLNSYKGQLKEGDHISEIWTSPNRYQNYTDCIEITDFDSSTLHFNGRLYNKIKGDITTASKPGRKIYAPLVYDKSTAYDYNLDVRNNSVFAKYYLCIEINPSLRIWYDGWNSWHSGEGASNFNGSISEYKTKINKIGSNLIVKNSFNGNVIKYNYSVIFGVAESRLYSAPVNLNQVQLNDKPLHQKVLNDLIDVEKITKCTIIPVLFTKVQGWSENTFEHSGGNDTGTESRLDVIRYYPNGEVPDPFLDTGKILLHPSRNADDPTQTEFLVDQVNNSLIGTFSLLSLDNDLYILSKNIKLNNYILEQIRNLFDLLTQVYVLQGTTVPQDTYCLSSYHYQLDFYATAKIQGHIKSTISEHFIIDNLEGFDNWNKSNLKIDNGEYTFDINGHKVFYAQQDLVDAYKALLTSNISIEPEEALTISCFIANDGSPISITLPDNNDLNRDFYTINNEYKLVGNNSGQSFNILFKSTGDINMKNDKITCRYELNESTTKSYDFLLFDTTKNCFYINTSTSPGNSLKFVNNSYKYNFAGEIGGNKWLDSYAFDITNVIDDKEI